MAASLKKGLLVSIGFFLFPFVMRPRCIKKNLSHSKWERGVEKDYIDTGREIRRSRRYHSDWSPQAENKNLIEDNWKISIIESKTSQTRSNWSIESIKAKSIETNQPKKNM